MYNKRIVDLTARTLSAWNAEAGEFEYIVRHKLPNRAERRRRKATGWRGVDDRRRNVPHRNINLHNEPMTLKAA